jgi:predicted ATPase/DNA-binding winged helix-turn-helix (wHTH) protein
MTGSDENRLAAASAVSFEGFQFFPSRRELLEGGSAVKLGTRALDILAILIENAGKTVSKAELITRVWPKTVVEDINLRVHVSALRRSLGDGQKGRRFIINVAGRGYSFVAALTRESSRANHQPASAPAFKHNLPNALTRMVGRSAEFAALTELVCKNRLSTVLGPGGVGKTTLALAVSRPLQSRFPDGIRFVDLANISTGHSIADAFAVALDLVASTDNPLRDLVEFLKEREVLLVVDNCERVLTEVAAVVETVLKSCNGPQILATSREPLNAEGERRYRIAPLQVPSDSDSPLTAAKAREHASVELFVERAATGEHSFDLTDTNAAIVADICRTLDGLPLAIELAAAGVGRMGLHELAARVHDQVSQGVTARRTAAARHQTLRAAIDWSFELLNLMEQTAFRRLAVFNGPFNMESAAGLIAHAGISRPDALNAVMSLAEKSLLVTDISGTALRHRILNTVRTYAYDKLHASDDFVKIHRWHADQMLKLMRQAELGWQSTDRTEWISSYGYAIDDVRAALDWAFSSTGDAALGAALTSISVPFGLQLARLDEFRARIEHALDSLKSGASARSDLETRLRETLRLLTQNMERAPPEEVAEPSAQVDAVERIGPPKAQIAPLLRKTIMQMENADYDGAVRTATRMGSVAQRTADPLAVLTADRVAAQAHHFAGNHASARAYAERVLDHPAKSIPIAYVPVQVDRRVWMRIVLSRTCWMEGQLEQAEQLMTEAMELAVADSPFSLCQTLAFATCPICIWNGEHERARTHVQTLLAQTRRYKLDNWRAYAEWYARVIGVDWTPAEETPTSEPTISGLLLDTIVTMSPATVAKAALQSLSPTGWAAPEKLRIQADAILTSNLSDAASRGEALLIRSMAVADSQRAPAWKLRAATTLSRLWIEQGSSRRARSLLLEVCALFPSHCSNEDLRVARSLLRDLS